MSNLFGCLNLPTDDRFSQAVRDALHVRPWMRHSARQPSDAFYLCQSCPDSAPALPIYENPRHLVLIVGEMYFDRSPADQIGRLALDTYLRNGGQCLTEFNGNYLLLIWDKLHESLQIASDPFGLLPLYYWTGNGALMFSTRMEPLLLRDEVSRELDPAAIVDFLNCGYCLADRTVFKSIRRLQSGSVLEFNGGLRVRRQSLPQFSDQRWHCSPRVLADEMYETLREAFRRRITDSAKVLITLSGGLDSRANLAFCRELRGNDLDAFTYGAPYHDDMVVAREVARVASVRHHRGPMRRDYLDVYLEDHLRLVEGATDITTAQSLPIVDFAQNGFNILPSGTHSGVLTGGNLEHITVPLDESQAVLDNFYRITAACRDEEMRALLRPVITDDHIRAPWDEIRRTFHENESARWNFQRVTHTDAMVRQRGLIFVHEVYFGVSGRVTVPAVDRDYSSLVLSSSHAALENQLCYRLMFNRHFPDLAAVVNANDDRPFSNNRRAVLNLFKFLACKYSKLLAVKAWTRLRGRVSEGYVTSMWDVMSFPDHRVILKHMARLRRREECWAEIFEPAAVDRVMREYEQSSGLKNRVVARRLLRLMAYLDHVDQRPALPVAPKVTAEYGTA